MPHKSEISITEKQIQEIINKFFPNEKLTRLTEIKQAFVNPIFEFKLSNNSAYILKINNHEWPQKQIRELKAIALAKKYTTIPLQNVVVNYLKDNKIPHSFLIFEKIPGKDLKTTINENLITKKEFMTILRKIGFHLGELHSITFDFYGDFCIIEEQNTPESNSYLWGKQFTTWIDCFKAFCLEILNWVDRTSFPNYRKPLEWKIHELSEGIEEYNEEGCFVHSDIQPSNILVQNGQLTGIIDFEWAYSGSPSFDFHLTKAGFSFSDFPSLEESKMINQLDISQEEIQKELLAGYQTSYKQRLTDLSTELTDFIWLLYMIGSWKWVIYSKTSKDVVIYENSVHELFSKLISH